MTMVTVPPGSGAQRSLCGPDSALSAGHLVELTRLNLAYLNLLDTLDGGTEERCDTVLGLGRKHLHSLRSLERSRRVRIASCPYALFRLRLGILKTASVYDSDAVYWPAPEHAAQHIFVTGALLYAWHLARSDRLAARATLGLSSETCVVLADRSVTHLHTLALKNPNLVVTRLIRQPRFWGDLIRAAAEDSREALETTRLAGFQWMAMQTPD